MNAQLIREARAAYAAGQVSDVDNIPCVCGAERVAHLGGSHAGGNPATKCTRYREDQKAGIVARAHAARDHGFRETMTAYEELDRGKRRKKRAGEVSVRPSDLRSCRRAIWYRETPPEGYEPAPTEKRQAWMGTLIHDAFEQRRAALYPWRMFETGLRIPGSDRDYRLDEYDPITGVLTEIKTAGDWKWDQVGQFGPDEKWLDQVMLYAYLLIRLGYPVEQIVLLVLQREGGLSEPFVYAYDEARALAALKWITDVAMDIELGFEPPRDEPGPSTSKMCAELCPARRHCWQMDDAEALGRSPENLVILGLHPDDETVAEHVESLVATREQRLAIEREERALRALVDGVELKEYGEFTHETKSTSGTAWKRYQEAVEAHWNDPDRPADPPKPETSRGTSTTWKRIRKSELDRRAKEREKALAASAEALDAPSEPEPEPVAEAS